MIMPAGIYMIRHYIYDGCGRHDQYDVKFEWDYVKAKDFLDELYMNPHCEHEWEHWDSLDDMVLIKKEGQYGYDYFYIQFIAPGEDID